MLYTVLPELVTLCKVESSVPATFYGLHKKRNSSSVCVRESSLLLKVFCNSFIVVIKSREETVERLFKIKAPKAHEYRCSVAGMDG